MTLIGSFLICLILLTARDSEAQTVDLLTGSLQYAIPLGTVAANDISVPVSIVQHGDAMRVAEGEGDCGMGWSLSAGGAITRIVRGLPDELNVATRKGWLHLGSNYSSIQSFSPAGDDVLDTCSDESTDFDFLDGLAFTYDTEPDLFYFQAPGISGQFVLNSSGAPQLLTLQDITISTFESDSFSITTNRGVVYSFTTVESTKRVSLGYNCDFANYQYNQYSTAYNIEFTSRWLLTRIESSTTGTEATISYTSLPKTFSNIYKEDSLYFVRDEFQPKRISAIRAKTFKAKFTWANNVVSHVMFQDTVTANAKTFELYYKTFKDHNYNATTYPFPVYKTFLQKIRQIGDDCSPYSSYEFGYANVDWSKGALSKPWKKNQQQDWYGYYNGVSGNLNMPTVYYYDTLNDAIRTRVDTISGQTPSYTATASNRKVVEDSARFGTLTRIVTPTGGIVDIEWESNVYYDSATLENLLGGGMRVKSISMNGSDVAYGSSYDTFNSANSITKSYTYLESDSSRSRIRNNVFKSEGNHRFSWKYGV